MQNAGMLESWRTFVFSVSEKWIVIPIFDLFVRYSRFEGPSLQIRPWSTFNQKTRTRFAIVFDQTTITNVYLNLAFHTGKTLVARRFAIANPKLKLLLAKNENWNFIT